MNCYNHPIQPAVAQCIDCGKGLCNQCATAYCTPICNSCNKLRIKTERTSITKELLLTFTVGITLAYLYGQIAVYNTDYSFSLKHDVLFYVIFSYIFAGLVVGWKTLTRITPNVFLILPIVGWLIFFIIKLFLSFWVGLIMLPIRTIINISKLIKLQK